MWGSNGLCSVNMETKCVYIDFTLVFLYLSFFFPISSWVVQNLSSAINITTHPIKASFHSSTFQPILSSHPSFYQHFNSSYQAILLFINIATHPMKLSFSLSTFHLILSRHLSIYQHSNSFYQAIPLFIYI